MCDYDNSSRLRRCCFGTCTSTFAENDHFEAKLPPSIYCPVAKKKKTSMVTPHLKFVYLLIIGTQKTF